MFWTLLCPTPPSAWRGSVVAVGSWVANLSRANLPAFCILQIRVALLDVSLLPDITTKKSPAALFDAASRRVYHAAVGKSLCRRAAIYYGRRLKLQEEPMALSKQERVRELARLVGIAIVPQEETEVATGSTA